MITAVGGPRRHQRHHRHRNLQHPGHRPGRPRRGAVAVDAGLRDGRQGRGQGAVPDLAAAHRPEHRQPADRPSHHPVRHGVLAEAGLSYVGLGAQPPIPSWGRMLNEAQTMIGFAPWLAIFPGLAVVVTVIGLNHLGRRPARQPRPQAGPEALGGPAADRQPAPVHRRDRSAQGVSLSSKPVRSLASWASPVRASR